MFGRLMPREGKFFDLFNQHAEWIAEGEESFLREVAEKFGWDGVVAWCAVKREMEPLEPLRTPKFYEAREFVLNK